MKILRDPFAGSMVVLVALVVAGFVAMGLAARAVAASSDVSVQVAYLVSGGLGGLGLVTFALGLIAIQCRRRDAARRRADLRRMMTASRTAPVVPGDMPHATAVVGPVVQRFPHFRYPEVMGLPLVALVVGGYLCWALTQPLDRYGNGTGQSPPRSAASVPPSITMNEPQKNVDSDESR